MREQRANPESSRTDSITKAIKMIIRLKYTAVLAILLVASNLSAAANSRVELGTLSCSLFDVVTKTAFPEARVDCQFTPIEGEPEMLSGKIGGIGGAVEISADATMTWSVYGPAGTGLRAQAKPQREAPTRRVPNISRSTAVSAQQFSSRQVIVSWN
jgi:hypothetical protein